MSCDTRWTRTTDLFIKSEVTVIYAKDGSKVAHRMYFAIGAAKYSYLPLGESPQGSQTNYCGRDTTPFPVV